MYANQEHSEVHEDASENGVVDQILSWLGLVEEEVEWQEGFESFTAGTWPSGWTGDANASSSGNGIDDAIAHSGANSLKLFGSLGGCWGALAYRAIGAEDPYELELYVRNGNESISGCHPERAYIGLRKGTHWSNPARMFLWFRGNGVIEDAAGNSLGTYDVLDWIKVRVKYERPNASDVVLSYWIDDVYQRSTTYAAHEEEDDLTNLDLTTQEGSVWFDDIRISR